MRDELTIFSVDLEMWDIGRTAGHDSQMRTCPAWCGTLGNYEL